MYLYMIYIKSFKRNANCELRKLRTNFKYQIFSVKLKTSFCFLIKVQNTTGKQTIAFYNNAKVDNAIFSTQLSLFLQFLLFKDEQIDIQIDRKIDRWIYIIYIYSNKQIGRYIDIQI